MKGRYNKTILSLFGILLLIIPTNVRALIWLDGNSSSGNIAISTSILIPLPLINFTITESEETDILGIAQLIITEHDDSNKYNTLQILTGSEDSIELPISYGSFGLQYLLLPYWPSFGVDQSDIYVYLSVAYGFVDSTINCNIDQSISIERDQLLELLNLLSPEMDLDQYVGEGPFDVYFSLNGDLSGKATLTDPTISGDFAYSLTLPEDIFIIEIPFEIPNEFDGSISIEADFDWELFSLFTSVNVYTTLTIDGEEKSLDPTTFDFLPGGTFILWLDREE